MSNAARVPSYPDEFMFHKGGILPCNTPMTFETIADRLYPYLRPVNVQDRRHLRIEDGYRPGDIHIPTRGKIFNKAGLWKWLHDKIVAELGRDDRRGRFKHEAVVYGRGRNRRVVFLQQPLHSDQHGAIVAQYSTGGDFDDDFESEQNKRRVPEYLREQDEREGNNTARRGSADSSLYYLPRGSRNGPDCGSGDENDQDGDEEVIVKKAQRKPRGRPALKNPNYDNNDANGGDDGTDADSNGGMNGTDVEEDDDDDDRQEEDDEEEEEEEEQGELDVGPSNLPALIASVAKNLPPKMRRWSAQAITAVSKQQQQQQHRRSFVDDEELSDAEGESQIGRLPASGYTMRLMEPGGPMYASTAASMRRRPSMPHTFNVGVAHRALGGPEAMHMHMQRRHSAGPVPMAHTFMPSPLGFSNHQSLQNQQHQNTSIYHQQQQQTNVMSIQQEQQHAKSMMSKQQQMNFQPQNYVQSHSKITTQQQQILPMQLPSLTEQIPQLTTQQFGPTSMHHEPMSINTKLSPPSGDPKTMPSPPSTRSSPPASFSNQDQERSSDAGGSADGWQNIELEKQRLRLEKTQLTNERAQFDQEKEAMRHTIEELQRARENFFAQLEMAQVHFAKERFQLNLARRELEAADALRILNNKA